MNKLKRIRFITFLAALYIMVAFMWWTVLLNRKNTALSEAETEVLYLKTVPKQDMTAFLEAPQYLALKKKHERQTNMIIGEGISLILGLLCGLWFIHRSFQKEIALNNQQRNFLLSITHELKSPIASIQLVLDTFRKRKLDEKQTEMLTISASNETERLNELVNNLLLSAKLDATYEPFYESVNLQVILDDIIAKLKLRFPKAVFNFENLEMPTLVGDRQGIRSVFNNLLENAAKYSSVKPVILIQNKLENDKFIFEIKDNGVGIPTNEKSKVFEKFYRVGSEDTRSAKGTGLGLFIVNQILKAHKGSIQVLDNEPQGTIFKIILPRV
jgi:signal transduction histidine kinase